MIGASPIGTAPLGAGSGEAVEYTNTGSANLAVPMAQLDAHDFGLRSVRPIFVLATGYTSDAVSGTNIGALLTTNYDPVDPPGSNVNGALNGVYNVYGPFTPPDQNAYYHTMGTGATLYAADGAYGYNRIVGDITTQALTLASGDFTIQFWLNVFSDPQDDPAAVFDDRFTPFRLACYTFDEWGVRQPVPRVLLLQIQPSVAAPTKKTLQLVMSEGGPDGGATTTSTPNNQLLESSPVSGPLEHSAWYHVAVTRTGGRYDLFISEGYNYRVLYGYTHKYPGLPYHPAYVLDPLYEYSGKAPGIMRNIGGFDFLDEVYREAELSIGYSSGVALSDFAGFNVNRYPAPVLTNTFPAPNAPILYDLNLGVPFAYAYLSAPAALAGGVGTQTAVASAALTAPSPIFYATAHDASGDRAAILTAPSPTLSAYAGASAALSAPTSALTAAGTVTIWATAELSAPASLIDATGSVSDMAQAELTAPRPNLIGYSGAVCSITLTGRAAVLATGTTGSIGGAAITCPLFELTASATVENRGSAELLAPSPRMGQSAQAYLIAPMATLTAIGHAVVTATYEAYAVNLNHQPKPGKEPIDEVTHYTNFPFTHIVRYQNSYFGANSTGLYLLEGTTDYASPTPTPIPWAFKTAMTDFKSPQHKTVASAYFGGRLGAAATVSLHVGEDGPQTYSYATVRTDHAQNYRQVFGKGTKARYYALGASGTGTMELDDIDLDVHNLTRRI